MQVFGYMPVPYGAPLFIAGTVLLALLGARLFHRFVPNETLENHNEIAGFVFAVVGVIYAVLLAFVAIGVWERFQSAESRTYDEAAQLAIVYRNADLFPAQQHALRSELVDYVNEIVNVEWPEMAQNLDDWRGREIAEQIAKEVRDLPVRSSGQQDAQTAMIQAFGASMTYRDERQSLDAHGINGFMWSILLAGAAIAIIFSYLFAYKNMFSMMTIVSLHATMLGLVLYFIAATDYPFGRNGITVDPNAFTGMLHVFRIIGP